VSQQDHHMRLRFSQFRATTNHGNRIVWRGLLQPTPWSECYQIEIVYQIPQRPQIRVLAPGLRIRSGCKKCPHTFEDGSLCVHQSHEWNAKLLIATTIVPWISMWLYFYEVWLRTGAWRGEGTHPQLPEHSPLPAARAAAA